MAQKRRQGANAQIHKRVTRDKISGYKPGRLVVLGAVIIVLVGFIARWLPRSGLLEKVTPIVAITDVHISGCKEVKDSVVLKAAGIDSSATLFNIAVDSIEKRVSILPGVRRVKARRHFDKSLRIKITERTPIAFSVQKGYVYYLDEEGALWPFVPKAGSYNELAIITGAKDTLDSSGYHHLVEEDAKKMLELIKTFSKVDTEGKRVVSYDISSPDMITVQWNGILPEIRIALQDLKHATSNIETLMRLLEQKEVKAQEYIDFSYRNVAFIK